MLVVPNAVSVAILQALVAVDALFNGAKVGLFVGDTVPSQATVLADLTPADFTGYALSSAITWGAPFIDENGIPSVVGSMKEFHASDPLTVANDVAGYFVVNGAGDTLLWAERFESEITVAAPTAAVVVVPVFGGVTQSAVA